jgi:hypothetical protein
VEIHRQLLVCHRFRVDQTWNGHGYASASFNADQLYYCTTQQTVFVLPQRRCAPTRIIVFELIASQLIKNMQQETVSKNKTGSRRFSIRLANPKEIHRPINKQQMNKYRL